MDLNDIHSNNTFMCVRCGIGITPLNFSGWEVFVKGNITQPVCSLCHCMETEGGEKSGNLPGLEEDILVLMQEIEGHYPLKHDYAEDGRYTWPDRWAELRAHVQ